MKNLTIFLFVFINLCCALSINAQCNNSNKKVGALIRYGSDDGEKTPLILIHGIHGTEPDQKRTEANQYWNEFKAKYVADKDLMSKYVIYDFQYYSNQESVQDIGCELGLFIDEKIPDRQHVILAHSMGGLVAKAYMIFYSHKNGEWFGQKGGESVIGAITLATPHHGTHGSNDVNALEKYIKFGWKQVIDKLNFAYWTDRTGFFSPQTLASGMPNRGDLRWDNYDKAITANSLTNNDVNIWLPIANRKFEQFASKVILYAGAMRLENMANSPQSALAIAVGNPIYNDHQRLSFANDVLVNGFSNKFSPTDGLVPYKSALLCDLVSYFVSPTMPNFICASKYKVRRFEAGETDALPNQTPDSNTLSIKRIRRGYDHKDMYEHPDVLGYVVSDLKVYVKNINPVPKTQLLMPNLKNPLVLLVRLTSDNKILLNMEEMTDSTHLSGKLLEIFAAREKAGVFKEGTNEVEKTVWILIPSNSKNWNITKNINIQIIKALRLAGASPINTLMEQEFKDCFIRNLLCPLEQRN